MGRVSKQTAKKARISDLRYDTVQEEKLLVRFKTGGRSVDYKITLSTPVQSVTMVSEI